MDSHYEAKYLKYKAKYLKLKHQLAGKLYTSTLPKNANVSDSEMKKTELWLVKKSDNVSVWEDIKSLQNTENTLKVTATGDKSGLVGTKKYEITGKLVRLDEKNGFAIFENTVPPTFIESTGLGSKLADGAKKAAEAAKKVAEKTAQSVKEMTSAKGNGSK